MTQSLSSTQTLTVSFKKSHEKVNQSFKVKAISHSNCLKGKPGQETNNSLFIYFPRSFQFVSNLVQTFNFSFR